MAKLIVVEGPDTGTEYELAPGVEPIVVGRDKDAGVALRDDAVSRKHFRVEPRDGGWRLVDLGSRNQTFLNGKTMKEAILRHGDLIRAGDTEFRFENPGAPVDAAGPQSTIIKELPAAFSKDSVVERLEAIERALAGARSPESGKRIRKVLEIYETAGASQSPQELAERTLDALVPFLRAHRGAVLLRESGRWVARAARTVAEGVPNVPGEFRVSQGIVAKVVEEGKAILSADAADDQRFRGSESVAAATITSIVAAPVRAGDTILGVLYLDRQGLAEPFTDEDLELVLAASQALGPLLEKATATEDLRNENRNLYRSLSASHKLIGQSEAILKVLEFIRRAAPTPMTVLIQGETGTGKELVASAIHYASPRRGRPLVAINCAALPENLVESELFGHERGAFTGAVARKKGRFELADGGTVFLDEISELSLACQAKLLRLLEERVFERVGGVEPIRVDVRIVAATNRNLQDTVAAGNFREDLYYRLNVLGVSIPPLRERIEDVPILAEHFLRECCGRVKRLGKAALKKLSQYEWPGNVRQLRNVIESAAVLGEGSEIGANDLVLPSPRRGGSREAQGTTPWQPISLGELEKLHVERVLEFTGGNKKRAAEILGIERCTLYAKIRHYQP